MDNLLIIGLGCSLGMTLGFMALAVVIALDKVADNYRQAYVWNVGVVCRLLGMGQDSFNMVLNVILWLKENW